MNKTPEEISYAPAVKVGNMLFCAGQIGRTVDRVILEDPEQQFVAAWENLRDVLQAGGCTFEDVVDMTTYHVDLATHMDLFLEVKNRIFPRGLSTWTCIGVHSLAYPALLVEIKCTAVQRSR